MDPGPTGRAVERRHQSEAKESSADQGAGDPFARRPSSPGPSSTVLEEEARPELSPAPRTDPVKLDGAGPASAGRPHACRHLSSRRRAFDWISIHDQTLIAKIRKTRPVPSPVPPGHAEGYRRRPPAHYHQPVPRSSTRETHDAPPISPRYPPDRRSTPPTSAPTTGRSRSGSGRWPTSWSSRCVGTRPSREDPSDREARAPGGRPAVMMTTAPELNPGDPRGTPPPAPRRRCGAIHRPPRRRPHGRACCSS